MDGFNSAQALYDAQQPPDSDDIDADKADWLTIQINDLLFALNGCDPEHVTGIKKELAHFRSELDYVKAGF